MGENQQFRTEDS